MEHQVDHEELELALQRCGATWGAAQAHGLLSGKLAIAGGESGFDWLTQVLEGTDSSNVLRNECEVMLSDMFEATYRQLSARQSEFEPLLPTENVDAPSRALALGHWCEGFLHGLVSSKHGDALKQKLGDDPLAEIIKDMLQITRAVADEDGESETDEEDYAELVEYLRVAAQLTYEELSEFRIPAENSEAMLDNPEVLH